jgi:hypothetical protein
MAKKRLGIIQSRGLGDIVIALPIAKHYHDEGWEILWPIVQEFIPNFERHVPWVKWIPLQADHGPFFYDIPIERLKNFKCDEFLPLYQHLTNHKFSEEKYFQYTKFDQYKYIRAQVPFLHKWRLADYITRDLAEEDRLYNQLINPTNPNYAVVHLDGSDFSAKFDPQIIPQDWQTIYIGPGHTPSIFNWLKIIEGAQSVIAVDSCIANMTDQMKVEGDLYFIQRSHIGLTPTLGQDWTWLE